MLDFVKLAREHHIPLSFDGPKSSKGWVQTHCPMCSRGSGFHLGFSLRAGMFNCWRCGRVQTREVVAGLLHITRNEAARVLGKYNDGKGQDHKKKQITRGKTIQPPPGTGPLKSVHRAYLRGRGFRKAVIERWELQGTAHLSGNWNWRIVFPVKNGEGSTVGWIGRSVQGDHPRKYRMTENEKCLEDPGGFVYGINQVEGDSIIVVEGPTDVWNMGPGTVATLGSDWNVQQAVKLKLFARRFILFDPGKLAQRAAQRLADWLSFHPGETEIITGLSGDPGSLPRREVNAIRKDLLGEEA